MAVLLSDFESLNNQLKLRKNTLSYQSKINNQTLTQFMDELTDLSKDVESALLS
jgi:hypothetical protein